MQKDETTEQRILAAAKKVFVEKGMDGARMQDIADAAGINKALLHYYFRSKEKLFEVIFKQVASEFFPRVLKIFESEDRLFVKIENFCSEYVEQMMKTPFLPIFFLSEINRQPETFVKKMWGGRRPPVEKFFAQVQEEIKAGIIKPIHPAHLLLNILSLCIFPFLARPAFQVIARVDKKQYEALMLQRKQEIAAFIIASIKR